MKVIISKIIHGFLIKQLINLDMLKKGENNKLVKSSLVIKSCVLYFTISQVLVACNSSVLGCFFTTI